MDARWGWALAAAALVAGWMGYGWRGIALALTAIAFWLLLQFSRAMRVLRLAANAPVGHVDSAVMLNARLRTGLRLAEVIRLTGSLGRKIESQSEAFAWSDAGDVCVEVTFKSGRCVEWRLLRPDEAASAQDARPAGTAPPARQP